MLSRFRENYTASAEKLLELGLSGKADAMQGLAGSSEGEADSWHYRGQVIRWPSLEGSSTSSLASARDWAIREGAHVAGGLQEFRLQVAPHEGLGTIGPGQPCGSRDVLIP
jgi:hypothetical protein